MACTQWRWKLPAQDGGKDRDRVKEALETSQTRVETRPSPTGWSHGFGVAHVGPQGQTNLYAVDIEHGAFVYGGTRYAA